MSTIFYLAPTIAFAGAIFMSILLMRAKGEHFRTFRRLAIFSVVTLSIGGVFSSFTAFAEYKRHRFAATESVATTQPASAGFLFA